jgi:hypothetical protein
MTTAEIDILQGNLPQLALNLLRAQTGQTGEQAQFALTQYLSSEEGQAALAKANFGHSSTSPRFEENAAIET